MRYAIVLMTLIAVLCGGGSVFAQEGASEPKQAQEQAPEPPKQEQSPSPSSESCTECHTRVTPGIVVDWQLSKHSQNEVGCATCHGTRHNSMTDAAEAEIALPSVCARCHEDQVNQFSKGKHALAWASMKSVPTLHWQPMAQVEGLKGCGGCHRVGLKTEQEVRDISEKGAGYGASSCDVCHTRHVFSTDEARSPQACRTCHMGMDHPQWEMYSSSKHGVRFLLKQSRMLPEDVAAPTCQSCHLQEGTHENRTAWGYMGIRMPLPEDPDWARDRTTILHGLGILDASGNTTPRAETMESIDVARMTNEAWQAQRDKMIKTCQDCHSVNFARTELEKGDSMVREADALMAEAIRIVSGLYQDGILKKPADAIASPDLLTFHDAPTVIEQKLFRMFLEYRMRAFKGAFHANPDYTFWYGWSPMQTSLTEIRERAAELRESGGRKTQEQAPKPAPAKKK